MHHWQRMKFSVQNSATGFSVFSPGKHGGGQMRSRSPGSWMRKQQKAVLLLGTLPPHPPG